MSQSIVIGKHTADISELEEIGFGSYHVYKARYHKKNVAIKAITYYAEEEDDNGVPFTDYENLSGAYVNFVSALREVIFTSVCSSHKNIIDLVRVTADDKSMYVYTRLMKHELEEGLENVSYAQKERYIRELASAVGYIHSMGIVHKDIKPDNILIDHEDHIKLCDFGLSTKINRDPLGTTIAGYTLYYRPPEILMEDTRQVSTSADMWAFGVNMYYILTGDFFYYEDSFDDLDESECEAQTLLQILKLTPLYPNFRPLMLSELGFRELQLPRMSNILRKRKLSALTPEYQNIFTKTVRIDPLERLTMDNVLHILETPVSFGPGPKALSHRDAVEMVGRKTFNSIVKFMGKKNSCYIYPMTVVCSTLTENYPDIPANEFLSIARSITYALYKCMEVYDDIDLIMEKTDSPFTGIDFYTQAIIKCSAVYNYTFPHEREIVNLRTDPRDRKKIPCKKYGDRIWKAVLEPSIKSLRKSTLD